VLLTIDYHSIQMAAYDTTTNIWTAASDGDLETVRRCIEAGAHAPHTPDAQGYTCLHAAASYGHHELLRFLIARPGVNLNCGDEDGDTPLHVVEDVESCRMLLAAGADASVRNGDGLSPAGNARGEGRDAIADLLASVNPAAAAADDASVIAARREAAADGDEAMEKLELSLNQLSEAAGVPSASEENSNKRARV
jgi:ankyrin repeat protein